MINDPVALVGSGCKFAGESTSPSKLWELLRNPRDVLDHSPTDRFNCHGFYHPDGNRHGTSNVRASYHLTEDHRCFDASFFNIKHIEAESIDPQQRIFMETVYEAVESAGMTLDGLRGSDTAVFVGQMMNDYNDQLVRDFDNLPTYFATGTSRALSSNRVSHFFDWHGPSMTIDTACSSSLVALHQAVRALRSNDCRVAVVGGVNLLLGPEYYISASKIHMLSPDGRCKMWDIEANGYGRGDGIAAVILKKLSIAIADGDHIECIIRETGVNQDGRTKGITAPNEIAQINLIRDTYTRAGLDLEKHSDRPQFFEAHGTGTQVGDLKEAQAINDAFFGPSQKHLSEENLFVGSVKTIIGHTEGCAGLAAILKASLSLQHGVILPNMHFNQLNPTVQPFYKNLKIPTEIEQWPILADEQPRRISVNGFGFGGSNSHVILESYHSPDSTIEGPLRKRSFLPFIFSAASQTSLSRTISTYSAYLKNNPSTDLRALSYTLNSRRSRLAVRASFSAHSVESLCLKLDAALEKLPSTPLGIRASPKTSAAILGVFTGQGAQWAKMGKELVISSETFRKSIYAAEKSLAQLPIVDRPSWSLRDKLMACSESSKMSTAEISQPLCTAVQIALVDLLGSCGVTFQAVVGHSSGEIVCAYAAGFLTATDAVRIAYYRGFHAHLAGGRNGEKGAMMAVGTSFSDAKEFCKTHNMEGRVSVAASNSSASATLSGDAYAIEEARAMFEKQKKFARLLKVDTAYHGHHMLRVGDAYVNSLRDCNISVQKPSDTSCIWYSSVNGGTSVKSCDGLSDLYWRDNMVKPVLFSQAIEAAVADQGSFDLVLEIGAHPALKGPALQTIQESTGDSIPYSGTLVRGQNDVDSFSDALGFTWLHGGDMAVNFQSAYRAMTYTSAPEQKLLKGLPTYSWDHDLKYWSESRISKAFRTRGAPSHELLGTVIPDGIAEELRWRNIIRPKEVPWLCDHLFNGKIVFPPAAIVSMALEAMAILANSDSVQLMELLDLQIIHPLMSFYNEVSGMETLFLLSSIASDPEQRITTASFVFHASTNKDSSSLILVANGRVRISYGQQSSLTLSPPSMQDSLTSQINEDHFYEKLARQGYSTGFQTKSSIKRTRNGVRGLASRFPNNHLSSRLLVHPSVLDLVFNVSLLAYCGPDNDELWSLHVPNAIHRISINPRHCSSDPAEEVHFNCQVGSNPGSPIKGALGINISTSDNAHTWVEVEGLTLIPYVGCQDQGEETVERSKSVKSIAAQLMLAQSKSEIAAILQTGFFAQLEMMLSIKSTPDLLTMGVDELGIDSLIAVEVRTWFMKNLQVDIPVLRILGGATIGELLEDAAIRLPSSLMPGLDATRSTSSSITGVVTPDSTSLPSRRTSDFNGAGLDFNNPKISIEQCSGFSQITSNALVRTEKMSLGQARFWFLRTYLEDQTTSNITATYRLTGEVRIADLARAVKMVGEQHEALRTCFFTKSNEPFQGVLTSSPLDLEHREARDEEEVTTEANKLLNHVYDLERGESMRILLLSVASSQNLHFLIIAYHHINMDGVSLQMLLSDLEKVYSHQKLSTNILQFPDFSIRQRREIEDGKLTREINFWKSQYPDFPPVLPLFPMSKIGSRVIQEKYHLTKAVTRISSVLSNKIKDASRGAKVTSFHFYLAVFKTLLHRFLKVDDLCIGIADANRNDFDTLDSVGMFLNLLPIRFQSKAAEVFAETLLNVKRKVYGALENSRLPYDVLLEELDVPRSPSHSPLFQAFVDYRQGAQEILPFGNCKLDNLKLESGRTAYDITLDISEGADTTPLIIVKTQSYLYSQDDTEIIMNSYINLLEAYAADPRCLIEAPSLFRKSDIEKAMTIGYGPCLESDWESTLPHRIDHIMEIFPERLAVKDGVGNALTFSALQKRVYAIADALLDTPLGQGSRVAVFQDPSADWICSLLAILRVGAVYVPLCLRNPIERLAAIVKAAEATVILTHTATKADVTGLNYDNARIVDVSSIKDAPSNESAIQNIALPQSPAVILFTSGTTGTPKGIILRHSSLRNQVEGYTKTYEIKDEIILQQSAFSFDFSMDQMFSALATGSTLYVVPKDKRGDPIEIAKSIVSENITYTKATPSEYASWIRYGASSLASATTWTKAFAGGERLTVNHLRAFRSLEIPQLSLFNSYGPGEISISSHKIPVSYSDEACDATKAIPAGKCLPNYAVYIVDEDLNPVPLGVPGEVLILGAGCSIGYLNNDELTRHKFISNFHIAPEYLQKGWTTAYRSGDRGRLRADGALLFDGRMEGDTQIKLRGLRIELGEIESSIMSTSDGAVTEAVVTVLGDEFLVAHVLLAPDLVPGDSDAFMKKLMTGLKAKLPLYMCPAMIIPIERIPLTPHLKIDRRAISALPLPQSSISIKEKDQDRLSETEIQLRNMWRTAISREAAGAFTIDGTTDFFHVGGSSMLLPLLQAKIRSGLHTVLPLATFFQASTLSAMATKIEETASTRTIDWAAETDVSHLSFEAPSLDVVPPQMNAVNGSKIILLTGSTGFLGRAILRKLVDDENVAKIHCLAVRPKDCCSQDRVAVTSEKIIVHEGDLAEPLLGLGPNEFATLASNVDMIIHSAAMRAFFEYYQLLRNVNFISTRELIKVALVRKIPIHFVSSGGLLQLENTSSATTSVASLWKPPTDGSDGYLASKWASEVALENATTHFDIPVYIHRALTTSCSTDENQQIEINEVLLDLTNEMLTLPDLAGWGGYFDLVPITSVVDGICKYIDNTSPVSRSVSFEHYPGHIRVEVVEMCNFLEKNVNVARFQRLNILKWLGRIKTIGFGHVISAQNLTLQSTSGGDISLLSRR